MTRSLRGFTGAGYDKGRGPAWQIAWQLVSGLLFVRWWCPSSVRVAVLRAFGAELGERVLVRHQVRVHCAALGCPLLGDPVYGDGDGMLHLLARSIALPTEPALAATAPGRASTTVLASVTTPQSR